MVLYRNSAAVYQVYVIARYVTIKRFDIFYRFSVAQGTKNVGIRDLTFTVKLVS